MNSLDVISMVSNLCRLLDKMALYEKDIKLKKDWISSKIEDDSVVSNMTQDQKINQLKEADKRCDQILEFIEGQRSELKLKLSNLGYDSITEVAEIVRQFN